MTNDNPLIKYFRIIINTVITLYCELVQSHRNYQKLVSSTTLQQPNQHQVVMVQEQRIAVECSIVNITAVKPITISLLALVNMAT